MIRTLAASLLVLVLAACGAGVDSPAASPTDAPASPPPASPNPSLSPGASPDADPSVPTEPDEHPATGLALVRFPVEDDPASQVFVVEADGSLRQVTGGSGRLPGARSPAWSPDRSRIAFNPPKVGAGPVSLVGVVNADGSEERTVGEGLNPRWSPDGTRILIEKVDETHNEPTRTSLVDVDSGEVTDLGIGFNAQWLPDGERISFQRAVEGAGGSMTLVLYVMTLADESLVELAEETEAFWSPDGSAVLLVSEGTIFLAGPDGSDPRELVGGGSPVWAPDSSRFAFAHDFDSQGIPLLAVVDLEGSFLWSGVAGESVSWSPDGRYLAVGVSYPEPAVQVLDAASGDVLWEVPGALDPAWASDWASD